MAVAGRVNTEGNLILTVGGFEYVAGAPLKVQQVALGERTIHLHEVPAQYVVGGHQFDDGCQVIVAERTVKLKHKATQKSPARVVET